MDLIPNFMNLVLPPLTFIALLIFLPPYLALKFLSCIRRHLFNENVAGKVVVVTGAAAGIGEQIAYEYAKKEAKLVLVDLKEDCLGTVAERARRLGSPDVVAVTADVSVVEDCKRFVYEAVNHFGKLDHLVNNAGIARAGLFENAESISHFSPIMDVNFWGPVYCTHFAIPHLRKSKGKIIAVASTCGRFPIPKLAFYNASKAAIINFYETLRLEIGADIGITIVIPGLIKSEMTPSDSFLRGPLPFIPLESKEECAKAIVKSACRGDKYLVEPSWFSVLFPLKLLCPEAVEHCTRWLFLRRHTNSRNKAD